MKNWYVWFVWVNIYGVKNIWKSNKLTDWWETGLNQKKMLKTGEKKYRNLTTVCVESHASNSFNQWFFLWICLEKMSISRLVYFCWLFLSFFWLVEIKKKKRFGRIIFVQSKYQKATVNTAINNWVRMKKGYVWFFWVDFYGVENLWKSTNWQIDEKLAWVKKSAQIPRAKVHKSDNSLCWVSCIQQF